jgi:hypothetical protein
MLTYSEKMVLKDLVERMDMGEIRDLDAYLKRVFARKYEEYLTTVLDVKEDDV